MPSLSVLPDLKELWARFCLVQRLPGIAKDLEAAQYTRHGTLNQCPIAVCKTRAKSGILYLHVVGGF
jgi:hypothetical protein